MLSKMLVGELTNIDAFVTPDRLRGCEGIADQAAIETDPFCSSHSIMVGDHP